MSPREMLTIRQLATSPSYRCSIDTCHAICPSHSCPRLQQCGRTCHQPHRTAHTASHLPPTSCIPHLTFTASLTIIYRLLVAIGSIRRSPRDVAAPVRLLQLLDPVCIIIRNHGQWWFYRPFDPTTPETERVPRHSSAPP